MTLKIPRPIHVTRREALRILGASTACGLGTILTEPLGFAQAPAWVTRRSSVKFPSGAIIRTILKDVSPETLGSGATMFHEHLARGYSSPPPEPQRGAARGATAPAPGPTAPPGAAPASGGSRPTALENSMELMVEEIKQAAFDGLSGIVDANASGVAARTEAQLDFMKRLATRVPNVHILVAGGPFKSPYSPDIVKQSVEELTEELVRLANTQRWGAFGEIGTSIEMTADERKVLTAIARAHTRTGVPIFTHTEHEGCASCALAQLDLLESQGVDLKHLVIGHLTDIKPGSEPLAQTAKAIAKRGAFLGFDTVGHQMSASSNPEEGKVKLVLEVLNAGYEDNLLLSADFSQSPQLKANWGNGFSTVLVQFVPKLKYAGVKDDTLRKIFVDNPRRFLAFTPKKSEK